MTVPVTHGPVSSVSYRRWFPAPYEDMRKTFRWDTPQRYNITTDVLDKHDPNHLAMLWENWRETERRLTFGDLQALTNRTANALREYGVTSGDRVAVMLPPIPESAAYPRAIEFVDDLPKTLTGKIRRVELRKQEARRLRSLPGGTVGREIGGMDE